MHPADLRRSSLTYRPDTRRSSLLVLRAPREPICLTYFRAGPKAEFPETAVDSEGVPQIQSGPDKLRKRPASTAVERENDLHGKTSGNKARNLDADRCR